MRIRFELENKLPVKNNRFHIKKSVIKQTIVRVCQSPAKVSIIDA